MHNIRANNSAEKVTSVHQPLDSPEVSGQAARGDSFHVSSSLSCQFEQPVPTPRDNLSRPFGKREREFEVCQRSCREQLQHMYKISADNTTEKTKSCFSLSTIACPTWLCRAGYHWRICL